MNSYPITDTHMSNNIPIGSFNFDPSATMVDFNQAVGSDVDWSNLDNDLMNLMPNSSLSLSNTIPANDDPNIMMDNQQITMSSPPAHSSPFQVPSLVSDDISSPQRMTESLPVIQIPQTSPSQHFYQPDTQVLSKRIETVLKFQAKLQSNLSYLATIADAATMRPEDLSLQPDLSIIPTPPTPTGQRIFQLMLMTNQLFSHESDQHKDEARFLQQQAHQQQQQYQVQFYKQNMLSRQQQLMQMQLQKSNPYPNLPIHANDAFLSPLPTSTPTLVDIGQIMLQDNMPNMHTDIAYTAQTMFSDPNSPVNLMFHG
ncbi:hypothetical protein EDC96DRAFT_548020 [Choanephora cucurbitarum]|nr:hypothetical protein EDC96DRAFT_548020 [Choanephora cucurbitarum]